jgi:hypothetical protein
MGFFDFLKPKKSASDELMEKMANSMFPKGQKDIQAGTKEVLRILQHRIDEETAQSIFLKSSGISRIAQNFDEERLRLHLSGYCLQYFTDEQVQELFWYLQALSAAMLINGKTPSEVKYEGGKYFW